MRARAAALAVALSIGTAACGDSSEPEAPRTPHIVRLAGCWMTVHLFPTPVARVRTFVPAPFRIGDYLGARDATLAIWVVACDRVHAGRGPAPAVLSLVGVQVATPGAPPGIDVGPADFNHYLLGADTNSPALLAALRAAGQPARLVRGLRFERRATARAVNPAPRGGFVVDIGATKLDRPHTHANVFWFGRSAIQLRVPHANDRYCVRAGTGCMATATAPAGSKLRRLLGTRTPARATTGFDHLKVRSASLVLRPRT